MKNTEKTTMNAVKLNGYTLTAIGIAIKDGANFNTLKADTTLAAEFDKLNGTIQSLYAAVADLLDCRRKTANGKQEEIANAEKVVKMHFDYLCLQIGSRTLESGITKGIYRTRYADFAVLGELFERCRIGCNEKRYDFSIFAAAIVGLLNEMLNGKTDLNRVNLAGIAAKAVENHHAEQTKRNTKAAETREANKAAKAAAEKEENSFKAYATALIKSLSAENARFYEDAIRLIMDSHATTEEKRAIIAALRIPEAKIEK